MITKKIERPAFERGYHDGYKAAYDGSVRPMESLNPEYMRGWTDGMNEALYGDGGAR